MVIFISAKMQGYLQYSSNIENGYKRMKGFANIYNLVNKIIEFKIACDLNR